jgi:hypothetical protein
MTTFVYEGYARGVSHSSVAIGRLLGQGRVRPGLPRAQLGDGRDGCREGDSAGEHPEGGAGGDYGPYSSCIYVCTHATQMPV